LTQEYFDHTARRSNLLQAASIITAGFKWELLPQPLQDEDFRIDNVCFGDTTSTGALCVFPAPKTEMKRQKELTVACNIDIFQQIGTGGTKGAVFEYVRKNTNHNSPVTGAQLILYNQCPFTYHFLNADLTSLDLRCNVGGRSGAETKTLAVTAGSTVTYSADVKVYHQGPVSFYMTKVENAKTADGSTKWFKIKVSPP
jgi:hypothetical protein